MIGLDHARQAPELWLALSCFTCTVALVAGWLKFGPGRSLLAVPNERSSHHQPTPTGGGVAVVAVLLIVLVGYFALGVHWAGWLASGGLVIALLGLADDVVELSARLRIIIQWAVVGVVLWAMGAVATLSAEPTTGWLAALPEPLIWLTLLVALSWFINLFNFMDGIDGLATAQSASFCLGALLFMLGDAGWVNGVLWAGVAASLGFAVFNAAPARIFMGDVGSAFWGYLIGLLALQLALVDALPFVASLVLLSAFWFDASYTLCVRIVTGQKFTEGHRSHLYQRLSDRFGHGRTTLLYLVLFVGWQWPLVWWCRSIYLADLAVGQPAHSVTDVSLAVAGEMGAVNHALGWAALDLRLWWLVLLACLPLAIGCVVLRAGQQRQFTGIETNKSHN